MIENGEYFVDFSLERKYENKNKYGFPDMLNPSSYEFVVHTDKALEFIYPFLILELEIVKNKRYEITKEKFNSIKSIIDDYNTNVKQTFSYIWT